MLDLLKILRSNIENIKTIMIKILGIIDIKMF